MCFQLQYIKAEEIYMHLKKENIQRKTQRDSIDLMNRGYKPVIKCAVLSAHRNGRRKGKMKRVKN